MSTASKPLLVPNPWPARRRASVGFALANAAALILLFGVIPMSGAPQGLGDRLEWVFLHTPDVIGHVLGFSDDQATGSLKQRVFAISAVEGAFALRLAIAFCLAVGVCYATHRRASERQTKQLNATYVSGAEYADGRAVAQKAASLLAADLASSGAGVALSPDIRLPFNREVQGVFVAGRPRYGKSTALRFMIDGMLARARDKLLVYDCKGDVTADWPSSSAVLLAPHDTRSWGWAIGRDVLGETGAREFAAALIKVSERDPTWTLGAQEIIVALVRSLQATRDTAWSWRDLGEAVDLPDVELRRLAHDYHQSALRFLTLDPESDSFDRTAASFVSTAMAPIQRVVRPLAQAWSDLPPRFQISLRSWLADELPAQRTIIFQRATHLPAISGAWITAAFEIMSRFCVGPALPDDDDRRLWFVLDEFSTLPKIEGLPDLLAQGPSKGVCVVLACQNIEQIDGVYGPVGRKSIIQTTGTQIVFRMNPGPTSSEFTETAIPKTELQRYPRTAPTGDSRQTDRAEKAEHVCLVTPHDLATLRQGEAIVVIEGSILRVRWPKSTWIKRREPMIEAAWVTDQGGEAPPA